MKQIAPASEVNSMKLGHVDSQIFSDVQIQDHIANPADFPAPEQSEDSGPMAAIRKPCNTM